MGLAALLAAAVLVQGPQVSVRHPQPLPDPIVDPVRVELRVTTTSATTTFEILDDALAAGVGRIEAAAPRVIAYVDRSRLIIAGNQDGVAAACSFRLVVSSAAPTFRLALGAVPAGRQVSVEVFNLNDEARPASVTRFAVGETAELQTNMALLRTGGPLPLPPQRPRLVLAHYYPWWDRPSWADPKLLDQPLRLYSTDEPADVARVLGEIRAAGVDAVIVSWQGSHTRGGFYARGLRHVLDAAQQAGLRVAVMLETPVANRGNIESNPPEVRIIADWILEIGQEYARHPAFLTVDGKPVMFAYVWGFAGTATWAEARGLAAAAGQQVVLMADTVTPAELVVADGIFTYSGTLFERDVPGLTTRSVSGARAYHLLGAAFGAPRLAAAAVVPGYDETRLLRTTQRVVEREQGAFYDRQWQAALASGADWVVITSWNEWAENTQIEAGQRFGEAYIWRTRFWSAAFRTAPR